MTNFAEEARKVLSDTRREEREQCAAEIKRLQEALKLWNEAWKKWGADPERSDTFDEAWGVTNSILKD